MNRTVHVVCTVVMTLGAAGDLVACGSDETDRTAVAAAKCALPVSEKAGFPEESSAQTDGVEVQGLGEGRYRVTGRSTIIGEVTKAVDFLCEVEPDASDKLRGFKVTRLELTPIN